MSKIKFYCHDVLSILVKFEAEKNLEKKGWQQFLATSF